MISRDRAGWVALCRATSRWAARIALSTLTVPVTIAHAQPSPGSRWSPLSSLPGAVLQYSYDAGGGFRDSVVSAGQDTLLIDRREFDRYGTTVRTGFRRFERTTDGIVLSDALGQQLQFPVPWGSRAEWQYRRQAATYSYSLVGDTVWTMARTGQRFGAKRVQLTVESNGGRVLARLLVVSGLGIVDARSVDGGSAQSYTLVLYRPPTATPLTIGQRPTAYPTPPRTTTDGPGRTRFFIGAAGSIATNGLKKAPEGSSMLTKGFVGGVAEAGIQSVLGLRGRYGYLAEVWDDSSFVQQFEFATAEVTLEYLPPASGPAVYIGGGIGWIRQRGIVPRQFVRVPTGSVGLRLGRRHVALILEGTYLPQHVPKSLNPDDTEAVPNYRRVDGDAVVFTIGLRVF